MPQYHDPMNPTDVCCSFCGKSRDQVRKLVQGGGVSLNKEKLAAFDRPVGEEDLIDGKYLLVQRGKKNYYLITVK